LFVQPAIAADAAANVEGERSDFIHRLPHVLWLQSSGQKDWNPNLLANPAAQSPIVAPSGSAQFLRRERGISRVQQNRINASAARIASSTDSSPTT